jgi:hypothetical protein
MGVSCEVFGVLICLGVCESECVCVCERPLRAGHDQQAAVCACVFLCVRVCERECISVCLSAGCVRTYLLRESNAFVCCQMQYH